MPQIAIRLDPSDLAFLDKLVADGRAASRAAAVRAGLAMLRKEGEERQIAEAYARAYATVPSSDEEDAWAALGSQALADFYVAAEQG